MNNIPNDLYAKIVEHMPILCVDVLVHDGKGNVLLVKRNQEPAKGKWWFVGGRVLKGERLPDCVKRKCHEEVGLEVYNIQSLATHEFFWGIGAQGCPTHTVPLVYSAQADDLGIVQVDSTSDEFKVADADEILFNGEYDDYVRDVLEEWLER